MTPDANDVLQASGAPIIFMFHCSGKNSSTGTREGCLSAFSSADATTGSERKLSIACASRPGGRESVAKPPRADTRSTTAPTCEARRAASACGESPFRRTTTSPVAYAGYPSTEGEVAVAGPARASAASTASGSMRRKAEGRATVALKRRPGRAFSLLCRQPLTEQPRIPVPELQVLAQGIANAHAPPRLR